MLGVLFGIVILVLLAVGLTRRKRSARAWVKEERHEESGHWIDKRSGERGTWGSLDAEMTQDRQQVVRQGRVVELAELLRAYASAHQPGFANLPEEKVRAFRTYTRNQAAQMIVGMEQIKDGQAPVVVATTEAAQHEVLKKQILDFGYHHYPALLELDIATLRGFDLSVGEWVVRVVAEQSIE